MGLGQIPGYMPGISFEVVTLSNCTVNSSTSVRFDSSPRQQCRIGFVSGNEPPLEVRTYCGDSIHGGVPISRGAAEEVRMRLMVGDP
jgi:hypothetical protein